LTVFCCCTEEEIEAEELFLEQMEEKVLKYWSENAKRLIKEALTSNDA